MKRANYIYCLILLIIIPTFLNCSNSVKLIKPDNINNPPIVPPRGQQSNDPPGSDSPLEFYLMNRFLDMPVEKFFYFNGRIPISFQELKNSGMILATPRSPLNNEFYEEVENISQLHPSGFVFDAMSDKAFSYSFLSKNGENFKTITNVCDEETWKQKLMSGSSEFCDAKLQTFLQFFPSVVYTYYRKHNELPLTISDMLEDFYLLQDGWYWSDECVNKAYIEFGIDAEHNRIYAKYKYSFGFKQIFVQDVDLWDKHDKSPENIPNFQKFLDFDKTPDADYLIINPWFKMNNLEELYDQLVD